MMSDLKLKLGGGALKAKKFEVSGLRLGWLSVSPARAALLQKEGYVVESPDGDKIKHYRVRIFDPAVGGRGLQSGARTFASGSEAFSAYGHVPEAALLDDASERANSQAVRAAEAVIAADKDKDKKRGGKVLFLTPKELKLEKDAFKRSKESGTKLVEVK